MGADRLGPTVGQSSSDATSSASTITAQRGRGPEAAGAEREAGGGGDDVLELVGLVDHDDVVLGQEHAVASRGACRRGGCSRRRRRLPSPRARASSAKQSSPLGHRSAPGHSSPADADRGPRPRRRLPVELGAVAGVGVLGPLGQPAHLVAQLGWRRVDAEIELPVLAGLHLGDALPADVVGPALEHGPRERRGRGARRGTAGPCWRAGPAAPWWRWRRPPCARRRSRGRGRRVSCRCRCRPARRGGVRRRWRPRRPRPSRAGLSRSLASARDRLATTAFELRTASGRPFCPPTEATLREAAGSTGGVASTVVSRSRRASTRTASPPTSRGDGRQRAVGTEAGPARAPRATPPARKRCSTRSTARSSWA